MQLRKFFLEQNNLKQSSFNKNQQYTKLEYLILHQQKQRIEMH